MVESFPNRKNQLFGREEDIQYLLHRAKNPGITIVVGRPLMGKTWTLNEVARRIYKNGECLLGYHESTGAESSHLLYSMSNLYARWLSESSMQQQAISLWRRHKPMLVPRVGQMLGKLFGKLEIPQIDNGVGSIVSEVFDGLAALQNDLLTAGIPLDPLPYEDALSLAQLVAKVSSKRIVLILDAWEKSSRMDKEYNTLERFLRNNSNWPHAHIILAIRNPEVNPSKSNEEVIKHAQSLCKISPAAGDYYLKPINLADDYERRRAIEYLRITVPASTKVSETKLLEMIDGFPGVIDFWAKNTKYNSLKTEEDLLIEAKNANNLRYSEFDRILPQLAEVQRDFAALLAFLPRLSPKGWTIFQETVLKSKTKNVFEELIDAKVLIDYETPTYGHDTRHTAARQWFVKHKPWLVRRVAENTIPNLAARITGMNSESIPFLEMLAGAIEASKQIELSPRYRCLVEAANAVRQESWGGLPASFDDAYKEAIKSNESFSTLIAMALINRGIISATDNNTKAAIIDFTIVVDSLPKASSEQIGKALYNRGLVHSTMKDFISAENDFTSAINLPKISAELLARVYVNRGNAHASIGGSNSNKLAITDFSTAIDMDDAPIDQVAHALEGRSITYKNLGEIDKAVNDYSAIVKLDKLAPVNRVARALIMRGDEYKNACEIKKAISDFTSVIDMQDAYTEQLVVALNRRGAVHENQGEFGKAIKDFTHVIDIIDAPAEQSAFAYNKRGHAYEKEGDVSKAILDFTSVIELPDAPVEQVAYALHNRGTVYGNLGEVDSAIDDFSEAIKLINVPVDFVATLYANRGITLGKKGEFKKAKDDFFRVINLPNVPEYIAKAAKMHLSVCDINIK